MVTVDSIVRSYILQRNLVWHDYFRLLVIALGAVKEISMDVNISSNVKAIEIDVDEVGNIYLPDDLIEPISLSISKYDKIKGMAKSGSINPIIKIEDGEEVKRGASSDTRQIHNFQRFGDRIQLDSRLSLNCVVLVYTSSGVISGINLVHPWSESTIKAYMDWKFVESRKGIWENQNDKRAFYVSLRKLYGRIEGFSYEDYMRTVRNYQTMGARN